MKSEIYQICNIVTQAKHALKSQSVIQYKSMPYEASVKFVFLADDGVSQGETLTGVDEWYIRCMYNNLEDIKFMIPIKSRRREALGYLNQAGQVMVCFFPGNDVRVWVPDWEFDDEKKGYNITYTEAKWADHPEGRPTYPDNIADFMVSLDNIIKFSASLGFSGFSEYFARALVMLKGNFNYEEDDRRKIQYSLDKGLPEPVLMHLDLPEKNRDMFEAAGAADAFGAMGSWNDSPAVVAHDKGLTETYNLLSDSLYEQITMAMMYAINEW